MKINPKPYERTPEGVKRGAAVATAILGSDAHGLAAVAPAWMVGWLLSIGLGWPLKICWCGLLPFCMLLPALHDLLGA
jgi:hypothetical protein